MSDISKHPEWTFCGRCKYFSSYCPFIDFEKEPDRPHLGICEHPDMNKMLVAAIADCSRFARKEEK